MAQDEDVEESVLLIHGTGAGDPADSGARWWQRDSDFWDAIGVRLGAGFTCQAEGELFRWSGLNSERERRAAGEALARRIEGFERAGQPYHLVGHSHGGSVIWLALVAANKRNPGLPRLRSWTTVGTPFLHYRPKLSILWLLVPLLASLAGGILFWPQFLAFPGALREAWSDPEGSLLPFVALPFFWAIFLFFFIFAAGRITAFLLAVRRGRREKLEALRAYRAVEARYLGLWSEADEAIGGLANTLVAGGALVPRMTGRGNSLPGRVAKIAAAPISLFYNRVIAGASDEFIWDRLLRRLQGSDRSTYDLAAVTRGPLRSAAALHGLPLSISQSLMARANREAAVTLAKVRGVLGIAAEADGPDLFAITRDSLTFRELIHNSYFDQAELRELIALHLLARGDPAAPVLEEVGPRGIWLRGCYRTPPAGATTPPKRSRGPRALRSVQAALALLIMLLGGAAASLIYASYVSPYTRIAQIDRIVGSDVALRASTQGEERLDEIRAFGALLVQGGFGDRALRIARDLTSEDGREAMLSGAAHAYVVRGEPDAAASIILPLLRRIRSRSNPNRSLSYGNLTRSSHYVLEEAAHLGLEREALDVAARFGFEYQQVPRPSPSMARIAHGFADAGRGDRAVTLLASIPHLTRRDLTIRQFVRDRGHRDPVRRQAAALLRDVPQQMYPEAGWGLVPLEVAARTAADFGAIREALELARGVAHLRARSDILGRLAGILVDQGRFADARRVAEESLALDPESGLRAAYVLARLARRHGDTALAARARTVVERADGNSESVFRHSPDKIIMVWAALGDLERAFGRFENPASSGMGSGVPGEMLARLIEAGRGDALVARISRVENRRHRSSLLLALAATTEGDRRRHLLRQAETAAYEEPDEHEQSAALAGVATAWAGLGQYRYALWLADRCLSVNRIEVYVAVLERYLRDNGGSHGQPAPWEDEDT